MDKKLECYIPFFHFDWINENWINPGSLINVILAILAIFIPFAIVFLTDLFNTKEPHNELDKKILSQEVFQTKRIFWYSVVGIGLLSLLTDKSPCWAKLLALAGVAVLIWFLYQPFKKILALKTDHERTKSEITCDFFEKLVKTNNLDEIMSCWERLWSKEIPSKMNQAPYQFVTSDYEDKLTELFISQIDLLIQRQSTNKEISIDISHLINTYKIYMTRRSFSSLYLILPKTLEWLTFEKSQCSFFALFCEVSKRFITSLFNKEPFELLRNYVDKEWNALPEEEEERQKKLKWIDDSIQIFFSSVVFSEETAPHTTSSLSDWSIKKDEKYGFFVAESVLQAFLSYTDVNLFVNEDDSQEDKNRKIGKIRHLHKVAKELFAHLDFSLFTSFLAMLDVYQTDDCVIKNWLKKSPIFAYGDSTEVPKKRLEIKQNTLNIILNCSIGLRINPLYVYQLDTEALNEEEKDRYYNGSNQERYAIHQAIQIKKLSLLQDKLKSDEIKEFCMASDRRELNRQNFLTLVNLLIDKINQPNTETP